MRQLAETDGKSFKTLGNIMGGGLTFERGVHGENDLVDAPGRDAADQAVDGEVFRTDAIEGGETSAEDVVAAGEETRAVERPEVGDLFHHAQRLVVAARVGADRAGVGRVDIAAYRAGRKIGGDVLEG